MEKNFIEITFLMEKNILHVPPHPFQGAKADSAKS